MELKDRISWVLDEEGVFPSAAAWSRATGDLVHRNTINDLRSGRTVNPERDTMEVLAQATALGRLQKRVSVAWLHHGVGAPYDIDVTPDPVYPERTAALVALQARGAPTLVIERLRSSSVETVGDPGFAFWLRKAAELLDEFDREQRASRVSGSGEP